MSHPILKIVTDAGCQSYLVGCPETREALVIDPKVGRAATYKELLEAYGLRLVGVVDTHLHADHLSDSRAYLDAGVPLSMSAATPCARPHRALREGDVVEVGKLRLRVLDVPGHTRDSIALAGHGVVFCGDTLFAGGLARADFRGSDPEQLFDSVQQKLMTLPDETLVFPGHGYRNVLFTTVGVERASNPALQHEDAAAFAAQLGAIEGQGNSPAVDEMLAQNAEADPELPEVAPPATSCSTGGGGPVRAPVAEEAAPDLKQRHPALVAAGRWIDVRDPYEYQAGHIPGAISIPLSELGFHLDKLRGREDLYVSCRSGVRSLTAIQTLQHLGVLKQATNVGGGILAWEKAGLKVEVGGD